ALPGSEKMMLDRIRSFFAPVLPRRFPPGLVLVPVVRLAGIIGFTTPLRPGLTLSSVARSLERAFSWPRAKAVALVINSPGGSAVQSHLVYQRIRQLAEENARPVIAFVEDVAASGGYMIACAADEIGIAASSVLGPIWGGGGHLRLQPCDREARDRATDLYRRRAQGDARSVPAREARGGRTPQGDPARDSSQLHCPSEIPPRCRPRRRGRNLVLRRILDRPKIHRAWPSRPDRRPSLELARTLRRQGCDSTRQRRTWLVRTADSGRGRDRSWATLGRRRFCRRGALGDRGACALGALRAIARPRRIPAGFDAEQTQEGTGMPPLIVWALGALGAVALGRW